MSGAGNHHADPLPDLRPPPRARKAARAWLAEARLRSTKLQRLTALGWALWFLRAPRHAGLRPPPGDTTFGSVDYRDPHIVLSECQLEAVRSGCECRAFDRVPLSFSRSLYKLVHFNTRRRLDNSMAYTCVTESSS